MSLSAVPYLLFLFVLLSLSLSITVFNCIVIHFVITLLFNKFIGWNEIERAPPAVVIL